MSLVWFAQTKEQFGSWSDASRLATIGSLVERNTWQIDESAYFKWAGDKVFLRGHFYSEKPPLLQVFAAMWYALLRYLGGAELLPQRCVANEICTYKWLTFLLVGLPSAAMIASFYWFSSKITDSVWRSGLTTALLASGTMIWPYSLVLNNHVPAAACLFIGFQVLLHSQDKGSSKLRERLIISGFLVALAASFDLTVTVIAPFIVLVVVTRHAGSTIFFLLGAASPVLLTMLFNYHISGSVLPAYFLSSGYDYPGSVWTPTFAAHQPPTNLARYFFDYFLGQHGLLMYCPLLLWALAGMVLLWVNRRHRLWWGSLWLTLGIVAQIAYLISRTNHFGGRAYGERFLIVWIPVLSYYSLFALPQRLSLWGIINLFLLSVASLISVFSAWQGVNSTWSISYPPAYLRKQAEFPYFGLDSKLVIDPADGLGESIRLGKCPRWELAERQALSQVPDMDHVLEANFDNKVMLLGYDLRSHNVEPGDSLPITIYWKPLSELDDTYYQSNQLLGKDLKRWGGFDRKPLGSDTACWEPGEIWTDHYSIPVYAEAPDGIYRLLVGLHSGQNDQAEFLSLVHEGRPVEIANVTIGPIKVGNPLPLLSSSREIAPIHYSNLIFGEAIRMVGYDMVHTMEEIHVTFDWRAVSSMDSDYTVFLHLLDEQGNVLAQTDAPPLDGSYPTSVWELGESIVDERTLPIPVAGSVGVALEVGWYDTNTGKRLPVPAFPSGTVRIDLD